MGDPICKWRAARPHNIVELVNDVLPHESMPEDKFFDIVEKRFPGFMHTPYQLACQLGLYVTIDGVYYPRFNHDISDEEAKDYLEHLVSKYYVPNPYTRRGFKNLDSPIFLEKSIVEYLEQHPYVSDFSRIMQDLIKEDVGNLSAIKTLLSYSNLFSFDGNDIHLNPNYKEIMNAPFDRNDKKAFFDVFSNQLKERKLDAPLQQIFFGAPGTGKSHTINQMCTEYENYRTTFHPDTDYASFVGSYKPITESKKVYTFMGDKAIPVKDSEGNEIEETKITYRYVFQAFLKAYIAAWKAQTNENPKPVFLVIEEINRGNCAQIFGDIFQLLDRNESGFSDYPIVADDDLAKELRKVFEDVSIAKHDEINSLYKGGKDIVGEVLKGSHLLLPNNLYIWATMNTSDQSLFPIDSAFKRRWEWKYIKIKRADEGYKIRFTNGNEYDWWQFVEAINEKIEGGEIQQEDKQLGYFFAKAKRQEDGAMHISAERFLSKVIFFLYQDVFKDFGLEEDFFKGDDGQPMTFASYFIENGGVDESRVERFVRNVIGEENLPTEQTEPVETEE